MVLDSELSTEHFPSMDVATIVLHFDYKHNDHGSILHKEDGTPVLACDGKNVLCDGQWKDPRNKEKFLSATSKAHANHGQQGPYQSS